MKAKQLKSGYTTGTHATAVVVACVYEYLYDVVQERVQITLPQNKQALIELQHTKKFAFSTIKVDNDDLDVTKGAKICCELSSSKPKNLKTQTPSMLKIKNLTLYVWGGDGVGIVTKEGLKIKPNHPAINPTPLAMIEQNLLVLVGEQTLELHVVIGVEDGEMIAKQTANAKVGVIGGISILGTRGIVKPISASAYLESIKTEINVAGKNADTIVFTLGNTAHDKAKQRYDEVSIVEIGNFVYDAMVSLKGHSFKKIVFIISSAKMSKVAQGFKNTHNRFGSIDFTLIKKWLLEVGIVYEKETLTLKAILDDLKRDEQERFLQSITQKAKHQIERWLREGGVEYEMLEVLNFTIDS
jgi:cobalt-precorrin-5B (C1)-methyltransferase